ncbi:MAG TPA: hypothetical protein VFX16_36830 [Pseudonocardiaceae bacterium]|nr:hypothetical protein [Pseudonocardiaceae bacterium]
MGLAPRTEPAGAARPYAATTVPMRPVAPLIALPPAPRTTYVVAAHGDTPAQTFAYAQAPVLNIGVQQVS